LLLIFKRYTVDPNPVADNSISVMSKKQSIKLNFDDFIVNKSTSDNNSIQEEYFELKSKYENMKKINEKIYNYAIEKVLNTSS